MNSIISQYPNFYLVLKALHIIFVVSWFAGLFYLPRLFVYHSMTKNDLTKQQFTIMEYKLFWYIMTPACILVLISGEVLAHFFLFHGWWLHVKVLLVGSLVFYHIYCFKLMEDFTKNYNSKTHKWFRIFNEYPTIILVACVFLVVIK